ncbi:MAG: Bax inhibitor-1/YccA family protein [Bacteroidales bacterium]|nr:Bax inhibitor-1/YccA family protein [Bacteroidales bacterium]
MGMLAKTSNPAFSGNVFEQQTRSYAVNTMTLQGTVNKSLTLLGIILVAALVTWKMAFAGNGMVMPLMIGGLIVGTICSFITIFKPEKAKVTSVIYAIAEGLVLGGISAVYEMGNGIVFNAILLTIGVFFVMLYLYKQRIIQPTQKFMMGIVAATGAIAIVYLIDLIMGFFGSSIGFLHSNGPLGIGISLVIVAVAALNFILDFKNVEDGVANGAPEYMEWYCAFGLMLTLVWLYLEMLRLLSKLNRE